MGRGRKGPEDHLLDLVNDRFDWLVESFVHDEGRRPTKPEIAALSMEANLWARDEMEAERHDHPAV